MSEGSPPAPKRFVTRGDAVFLLALLVAAAAFALYARRPAENAEAAFSGAPELIAATFNAQWCSSCKILKPRLLKIIPEFRSAPVKFVEYDLTFGPEKGRAEAAADGISSVYDRFSTATGYTLLIDAETGEILDMLTVNHERAAMREAIRGALRKAEAAQG
jgi:thiol-disulfide isomerase/thioredoxin